MDANELVDCRWFTKDECAAMLMRKHPDGLTCPPPVAIAHHIIRDLGGERRCPLLARPPSCAPASPCRTSCSASTQFPQPGGKCMTNEFIVVSGGCAVNAAIAVARLGGRAHYAGPLGDANDNVSNQLMAEMAREGIDTAGVVRVAGATAPVSGIMVDAAGERMIVTHRDKRIETARARRSRRAASRTSRCCSPTTAFPICAAGLRGGAAARHSRWCSTPTGRPSRTIRCLRSRLT